MAHSSAPDAPDMKLDRTSEVPLGTQLVWRLRALIGSGELTGGERLPGVREMAAAAGVNVNTVRSVYARLASQGLIVSEHGRGTFVADRLPPQDELGRIAEEAADSARRAGIDPRDLAAALYAARPAAGGAQPRRALAAAGQPFASEARRRSTLRTEIAGLERELAPLELPGDAPDEPAAEPERRRPPTPQLLTAAELEAIRDDLLERLHARRADRVVARQQRPNGPRLEPEPEPRQRAIGTAAPKFVAGAGGWTLRWRG